MQSICVNLDEAHFSQIVSAPANRRMLSGESEPISPLTIHDTAVGQSASELLSRANRVELYGRYQ